MIFIFLFISYNVKDKTGKYSSKFKEKYQNKNYHSLK